MTHYFYRIRTSTQPEHDQKNGLQKQVFFSTFDTPFDTQIDTQIRQHSKAHFNISETKIASKKIVDKNSFSHFLSHLITYLKSISFLVRTLIVSSIPAHSLDPYSLLTKSTTHELY